MQVVGQTETAEIAQDQTPVVKMKKLKPSNKEAIKGAFPLLYPYGDSQVLFDMASFLTAKKLNPPAGVDVRLHKVRKLTWQTFTKRELYSNTILLNAGNLMQRLLLRTHINIEDLRLLFLEIQQKQRLVSENEIQEDEFIISGAGRIFL